VLALALTLVPNVRSRAEMQIEARALGGGATNDIQAINSLKHQGLYDEAEARCLQALQQKPDDATLKRLLTEIETERGRQQNAPQSLKRKIETLIVPEVNVREATVGDVVEFLQNQGQTLSEDKAPINIVWQAPEEAKTTKVTLNLRDVPLADALKYVTQSAGLRYRVDPHAIVIYSVSPVTPGKSAPSSHAKP